MAEYDMPIEEQLKLLVKKFGTFETSIDKRFASIDERFNSIDEKFNSIDERFNSIDQKLTTIDARLGTIDGLDSKVDALDAKVGGLQVRLDETHQLAKMGLEGIQGLREETEARFDAVTRENAEQTELLKSVFVHVRQRVERLEQPKTRRRRS